MRLSEKRMKLATEALEVLARKNIQNINTDNESIFVTKLREISVGKSTAYDKGMNWVKIDQLSLEPELNTLLTELDSVDGLYQKLKWIPWI